MSRQITAFHKFVGQRRVLRPLSRIVRGARAMGEPAPHFCLVGQSGVGKTMLARAIAEDFGTACHVIVATPKYCPADIARDAGEWSACDFVFIDEIHSLNTRSQETLYRTMSERRIPRICEGRIDGEIGCPPVTVVGATDQPGRLNTALVRRFVHTFRLEPYSLREQIYIVRQCATNLGLLLSPQAAHRIAAACRGIPRKAVQLLGSLRHFYVRSDPAEQDGNSNSQVTLGTPAEINKPKVDAFLCSLGIDGNNNSRDDRQYMKFLGRANDRPTSLQTLALSLGLDERAVERQIEPWLVKNGWVEIVPGGRRLTPTGLALIGN